MKLRFKSDSWIVALLIISLIISAIVLGPVLVIWSLNTLFPVLAIPFTFYTWLATGILLLFLMPNVTRTDK